MKILSYVTISILVFCSQAYSITANRQATNTACLKTLKRQVLEYVIIENGSIVLLDEFAHSNGEVVTPGAPTEPSLNGFLIHHLLATFRPLDLPAGSNELYNYSVRIVDSSGTIIKEGSCESSIDCQISHNLLKLSDPETLMTQINEFGTGLYSLQVVEHTLNGTICLVEHKYEL